MKKNILLLFAFLFSLTGFSQLTENFEGGVFPPPTWAVFDNGVNGFPVINWSTSTIANGGITAAFMQRPGNIGINQTSQDYLATPAITIPANGQLKFFTRTLLSVPQPATKYLIKIKPVSAGVQNDPTGYALVQQYTDADLVAFFNIYEQKTINIPTAFTGVPVYVAFCLEYTQPGATGAVGNRWLVDDVNIVSPCISPALTSLTAAPIFANSATLGWASTGVASYDIEHVLSTATFSGVPTGSSTTNIFVQNGLSSLTGYQYQVRANCGNNNFGPWIGPRTYVTTAAPPECGGNFIDNGGTANYNNGTTAATGTTTICPLNPGDKVTVTFNTFDTEVGFSTPPLGFDGLYVYDGNTALSPQLSSGNPAGLGVLTTAGAFWGTTIPAPFTSTSPDGCLTFVFLSDSSVNRAGWTANVTCAPPPACQQPTALLVNNITATTAQLSWTSPGVATTWEIFVLPDTAPAPLPTATGFATTTTNNYTATLLSATTNYVYYVRGNCGAANGVSLWSGPKAFTTIATCPRPTISTTPNTVTTTTTTATINWTEVGTATVWHIYAVACGGAVPTATTTGFTTVTSNPGTIFGLTAGTCYDFYVRSFCSPTDSSLWTGPQTKNTQVLPPACGGNFVDNGGIGGLPTNNAPNNYLNSSNEVATICPNTLGEVVTVNFSTFDTEANWDALYVYDGNTINPLTLINSGNPPNNVPGGLAGGFWGTISPGTVTSTSADGCLTFVFRSDAFINKAGWNSTITCGPRPTCAKPKTLITSGVTSTNVTLAWTQPTNFNGTTATTWQVIAVPCASPLPLPTNPAWITTTSNPYSFTTLSSDTCYDFYVKAICSPTETSPVGGPKSATTQITPPVCNGTFVDNGGATGQYLVSSNVTTTICPTNIGDVVTVTFTSFNTEPNFDGIYVFDGPDVNSPQITGANPNPPGFGGLTLPGAFWGTNIPGPFTSSSPDGCLTFRFISDGSGQREGWIADVTCAPAPTCRKPNLLLSSNTTLTSSTLSWSQLPNPNGSTSSAWQYIILPAGSPAPTASTVGWIATTTITNNIVTGLASATCYDYYVRSVCSSIDLSSWAGPKSFCTLIANDECANATNVLTNPNQSCANIAAGSLIGATPSAELNNCGNAQTADAWFTFTATSTRHSISLINVVGNAFNLNYAVYSGTCNNLTQISCVFGLQGVSNNLVVGQNYTIRVFINSFANNSNLTFNVCVGTIPPTITTNTTQYTNQQLVTDVLLNSTCATVSNITFATESNGIGYFEQNGSTFPFANGVVLSTGNAGNAFGPNNSILSDGINGTASDADLEAIILAATGQPMNSKNATKLEFDFTPITSNISFDFLFASEEYGTFQCLFSDAFAFLLTNLTTGVTTNLAIVPGTTTPISVVTVRDNTYNNACASVNPTYFGQYNQLPGVSPLASPTNFNGQTKPLTATSAVTINQPYHIKLVVADRNDTQFDSAVFLKGSSFGIGNLNLGNNLLQSTGNALCFGTSQLIDTGLNPLLYSFEWKKDGIILPFTTSSITVTTEGTYSVHVTYIGSNCVGDDSVIVEYYPDFITGTPSNLSVCDVSGTGIFNLTQNTPTILSTLVGGSYNVNYFTSLANANANTNVISSVNEIAFSNTSNPQTIYVRIKNTVSGCYKTASFTLNIQNIPPQFTVPNTLNICTGQNGTIAVNALNFNLLNVTYIWKKDNVLLTNTTSSLSVNQAGSYEVTVNNAGCIATNTTIVNLLSVVADVLTPIIKCDSYVLPTLSIGNNYYTGINGSGAQIAAGTVINNSLQLYIFKQIGSCSDENNFIITINKTPIIPNITPVTKCDSYTLPPLIIGNYFTGTNGTGIPKNAGDVITSTQTLFVFANTNTIPDCSNEVSFLITIVPSPVISSIANVKICEKYVLPTLTTGNYFSGANGTGTLLNSGAIINNSQTIYVYAQSSTTPNCTDQKSFIITIDEKPMFGITGNCQGGNYTLDVVPQISGATYKWTDSNVPVPTTLSSNNSSQVVGSTGTYYCEVTNSNGCITKIPFAVTNIVCDIQKGISPNGDGKNDKFDLSTLNVKQLEIYNRYGSKVFGKTSYTNEWEGQSESGVALPDGTYYYVAELGDGNTKTGWIYINK